MADQLPINFVIPSEPVLKSYDWYDLASAQAYKQFYFMGGGSSAGDTFFLTTNSMRTDSDNFNLISTDKDFDITFNQNLTIAEGTAFFRCACEETASGSFYVDVTIYHVDSSGTETSLGTARSRSVSTAGQQLLVSIAVTRKKFSVGEKLRVNLAMSSTSSCQIFLEESQAPSCFIYIPFEVKD
jgi:hypothetical protein